MDHASRGGTAGGLAALRGMPGLWVRALCGRWWGQLRIIPWIQRDGGISYHPLSEHEVL